MKTLARPLALALAFGLAVLGARGARAQTSPPSDAPAPAPADGRQELIGRLELGYRGSFVGSSGFDPFSDNDYLPQFSLEGSRTIFQRGAFSFAPGLALDVGGTSATARGDDTSLSMQRVEVPLEGRLHFGRWGYAFLRVAPGAAVLSAQVQDSNSPQPLTKSRWLYATDLSAGYSWLVWPGAKPWFWLQAEFGYGFVASERLTLQPSTQTTPPVAGVDLGDLSLSGPFLRIAAAVSY
ncbi:MAG TPA: hypothetical protein VKU41_11480 [Polyangiaceae bacterium]|nr:hypothetical protein [Polyangiaceae bacterium]